MSVRVIGMEVRRHNANPHSVIEMVAFVNSLIKAMNLSSGEEILQIFQASERVAVDLER